MRRTVRDEGASRGGEMREQLEIRDETPKGEKRDERGNTVLVLNVETFWGGRLLCKAYNLMYICMYVWLYVCV